MPFIVFGDAGLTSAQDARLTRIEAGINQILKGLTQMNQQIADFKTKVDAQFVKVNASLDNIVADEAALNQKIKDLAAQIAAGGSTLTPEDQAALDSLATAGDALVAKTQGVADAVPDTVPV